MDLRKGELGCRDISEEAVCCVGSGKKLVGGTRAGESEG